MSLIRFTSNLVVPLGPIPLKSKDSHDSEALVGFERALHLDYRLQLTATIPFPNRNGRTHAQFMDFYNPLDGDTVLVKCPVAWFHEVADDPAQNADGTAASNATGASGELFYTRHKYIHHVDFDDEAGAVESATTLVVKSGGVVQTITTDYTVTLNGTTPLITTTSNFDAGAVEFSYEFYHAVRFDEPPLMPQIHRLNTDTLASPGVVHLSIVLLEDRARGRISA